MKCNFCSTPWDCRNCQHHPQWWRRRDKLAIRRVPLRDFMQAWTLAVWWRYKMRKPR